MRIFLNFPEAFGEIKRDLKEMGIPVATTTMQDKVIEGDQDFVTLEIQNYVYTVTDPQFDELNPTQPWADAEWSERLDGILGNPVNPGEAWKLRADVWEEFLHDDKFSYTYSNRFAGFNQLKSVVDRLRQDHHSRQLYVAMWNPWDSKQLGEERVPCSLGWHFMFRNEQLNMTYFMRSCDISTHFQNDIYLSMRLQEYIANAAGLTRGNFTQFISSLHVYNKDVEHVF